MNNTDERKFSILKIENFDAFKHHKPAYICMFNFTEILIQLYDLFIYLWIRL